ncbi:MAG: UDP-N-acetylmuramate dehydrogenase [Eubacterium sp.]|nr:UDP-N-acetylmuramate dehydrogenase [Eubacterium sp.]
MKHLSNEPMKLHTTFRVGGPAEDLYLVETADEIVRIIDACEENDTDYYIIGNGSNLLVSDKGFKGTIIEISNNMNNIKVEADGLYAEAGALLSAIATTARDNSFTGFEFASGIPGTLGGAVTMNAGAYGGEMKDVVEYVDVLRNGRKSRIPGSDMDFSYRHSRVMEDDLIVLGAKLIFSHGSKDAITAHMKELRDKRNEKQPVEFPSAGSTFKRPEGYFAGKLIMDAGLKGFSIGGAQVSEKHAGFIINKGEATADDIYKLICHVQKEVEDKFGVKLEMEVRMLGEF